jgi:hypothetical protein
MSHDNPLMEIRAVYTVLDGSGRTFTGHLGLVHRDRVDEELARARQLNPTAYAVPDTWKPGVFVK